MRIIKTILSAAAAAVLLLTAGCGEIEFPFDTGSSGVHGSSEPESREKMTAEELSEVIYASLSSFSNTVDVGERLEMETVRHAMQLLDHSHPEIFWTDGYTLTTGSRDSTIEFDILRDCSAGAIQAMYSELTSAADRVIGSMPEYMTDYERVLYVHDTIINSTSYSYTGAESSANGLWGTAYGCLVNGSAVCQGYSEAFLYIMNRLGMESGVCTGVTADGRHAWNYVNVAGEYYWIDLTWDDPDMASPDGGIQTADSLRHTYFLMDDRLMLRTREPDNDQLFIPECSSMAANYFVRTGCYFDSYSLSELGWAMLQNAGDDREISVMYSDWEPYQTAVASLFEGEEIWDVSEYVWLSDNISYSTDDLMYVITIQY
ncbi:MAG: hypothetical protein IJ874_01425 [Ruminococcus sp.]|nr:hypothetical protein [Ruminococcus sp.]